MKSGQNWRDNQSLVKLSIIQMTIQKTSTQARENQVQPLKTGRWPHPAYIIQLLIFDLSTTDALMSTAKLCILLWNLANLEVLKQIVHGTQLTLGMEMPEDLFYPVMLRNCLKLLTEMLSSKNIPPRSTESLKSGLY